MDYPLSGETEAHASFILNAVPQQKQIGSKVVNSIERGDGAVTAYSQNGKVYSVRIRSPFSGDVRGIRIGYTKDEVIRVLGKPNKLWPVHDGIARWFYDAESFMRVDFDPETNVVEFIYV
ncbi:hypothetical protein [Paraburkholderia megapolitana]|uniref:hypothetical protein n=1 Tax=Paraburkholderia megapolitana TaxID=420953 RepID=UPI0038B91AE9